MPLECLSQELERLLAQGVAPHLHTL